MAPKSIVSTLACAFAVWLIAGCSSTPSDQGAAEAAPGTAASAPKTHGGNTTIDTIRVGDKLTVKLSDIPQPYSEDLQVRDNGTINLPLNVEVVAAGKRKVELQEAIHEAYVPKYFKRLTVSVETEERWIYVGGQVRSPNRYIYSGEITVLKAIKVAGDFTEFANRAKVLVTRPDGTSFFVNCKKAEEDATRDKPVFPGYKIEVRRKFL